MADAYEPSPAEAAAPLVPPVYHMQAAVKAPCVEAAALPACPASVASCAAVSKVEGVGAYAPPRGGYSGVFGAEEPPGRAAPIVLPLKRSTPHRGSPRPPERRPSLTSTCSRPDAFVASEAAVRERPPSAGDWARRPIQSASPSRAARCLQEPQLRVPPVSPASPAASPPPPGRESTPRQRSTPEPSVLPLRRTLTSTSSQNTVAAPASPLPGPRAASPAPSVVSHPDAMQETPRGANSVSSRRSGLGGVPTVGSVVNYTSVGSHASSKSAQRKPSILEAPPKTLKSATSEVHIRTVESVLTRGLVHSHPSTDLTQQLSKPSQPANSWGTHEHALRDGVGAR
eukprot:TRINITY_DN10153_c1_g2_i1.p1 TRINITY_DN10153_c1_g2~~TRINITY_DN10153_c1_g2_i1.p1  ORF type:complete len:366 (+),score=97.34 TRINITY_DN10153_c1_g2_i1:73-1098(+)